MGLRFSRVVDARVKAVDWIVDWLAIGAGDDEAWWRGKGTLVEWMRLELGLGLRRLRGLRLGLEGGLEGCAEVGSRV